MRLSEIPRQTLVRGLGALYLQATEWRIPTSILENIKAQIDMCHNKPYNPKNVNMVYTNKGNDRHENSLAGEVACYIYVMHLIKTRPPWLEITIAESEEAQVKHAIDLIVSDGTDKFTVQVKTAKVGTYKEIKYEPTDTKGIADVLSAVDWENRRVFSAPRVDWKRMRKEAKCEFIPDYIFQKYGKIEQIDQQIVNLVDREFSSQTKGT